MPASPFQTMTTWQNEDGSLIGGEFSHVTESEWFDGGDEPCRLIRRTWHLVSEQIGTYYPHGCYVTCPRCNNDHTVADCAACDGDGIVRAENGWVPDAG